MGRAFGGPPLGQIARHFRDHVARAPTTTVSPIMNPLRATSSMLCSVALLTVTPPTNTGSSFAAGVSAPVRPTLKIDVVEQRHLLVGRELVRERPARRARHEAELLLVGAAIHLVDDAVDLVRQLRAARADVAVVLETSLDSARPSASGQVRSPSAVQPRGELAVPLGRLRRPRRRRARRNTGRAAAAP